MRWLGSMITQPRGARSSAGRTGRAASVVVATGVLLASTWTLAQPPQRLLDYAATVGPHQDDPRIPNVGTPQFGGVFTFAFNETLASLDSHTSAAGTTTTQNIHFAEGLFAFDATGSSTPDLVDSYSVSPDGLTYTFSLRQGVPFHNGEVLAAGDVVASLERWFGGTLGSQAAQYVQDLSVIDQYTVQMVLNEPFSFIIYQLTVPQTTDRGSRRRYHRDPDRYGTLLCCRGRRR